MATITITINNAHITRVVDALSEEYDYLNNRIDETETKNQFAKRMIAQHIRLITRNIEKQHGRDASDAEVSDTDVT